MPQTPIDQMEQVTEYGGKALFDYIQQSMESLGDRPYMETRLTEKEELEAYQALRNSVDGLYYYADGIRVELDSRLAQYSAEERIALGLSDEEVRKTAYTLTLIYMDKMNKLSAKLGIPIEGLELVPEPLPPMEMDLGGEEWLTSQTSLEEPSLAFSDPLAIPSMLGEVPLPTSPMPLPQSPSLPPLEPSLPLLPPLQQPPL